MSKKHYSFAGVCMLLLSVMMQDTKPTVADLAWLAGCWDGSTAKREYSEQWMKPSGQTLLGMSRTVVNGKTVAFEFLQIREQEGEIYYIAKPSGQAEASFKLIKHGKQEAVFENPEHDFPQRIIYRLAEDGSLAAAIEGMSNGKMKKIDFPMKRIACD
ncbi:hypothetical protein KJ068_01335 [bacterium]|nr:MAG: hypothetical protein EDS67_21145 [candidate division KSB1 bacterium]MBC6947760.1 hypothetical protein [candidate division KSB1 bacterium]MCE7943486.1 hypothetical protein [Chlorobi bacterium CHB1]MCL4703769.1 hypothetical protein [bacterium]MDL1877395.1 hypothetical protein [Cytophagia bacterium CHB2]